MFAGMVFLLMMSKRYCSHSITLLSQYFILYTVVTLFFTGYQFSWFSWVVVNHEIWYPTNRKSTIALYAVNARTMNLRNHNLILFRHPRKLVPTKIKETTVVTGKRVTKVIVSNGQGRKQFNL